MELYAVGVNPSIPGYSNRGQARTVVALVLVLCRLSVPVVALGVLGLAVVTLVLVLRLGVVLGVPIVALVLVLRLGVVLGLACAEMSDCQPSISWAWGVTEKFESTRKLCSFPQKRLSTARAQTRTASDTGKE